MPKSQITKITMQKSTLFSELKNTPKHRLSSHFSITLKQIKSELEKLKTLDEKKQFLDETLKSVKGEKLKTRVQKLLDEVLKHLGHEAKLTKEIPLEEKLAGVKEAIEVPSGVVPEIKYISRRPQASQLEQEVSRGPMPQAPVSEFVKVKYEPPSRAYEHQRRVESFRFYLSEQQHLAEKFTRDAWTYMADEQKRQVMDVARQTLGFGGAGSIEEQSRIMSLIYDTFSEGKKPENKYKTKT
jgi:flagellar biosynthesis/type III secretory pathway chaperone